MYKQRCLGSWNTHWPSTLQSGPGLGGVGRKAACGRLRVWAPPLNSAAAQTEGRRWGRGRLARSRCRARAGRPSEAEAPCCTEGQGQEQHLQFTPKECTDVLVEHGHWPTVARHCCWPFVSLMYEIKSALIQEYSPMNICSSLGKKG